MVMTRSGNRVTAQDPTTKPTAKQVKRKSSTINTASSTTSEPAAKIPKTDLAEDLNAESKLPPAPAPTPVTPHPQLLSEAALPAETSTITAPALIPASTAAPVPTPAVSSVPAPTVTETIVPAPVPAPAATLAATTPALETLKEPAPESAPLPDMATVLTQQPVITATTTNTLVPAETLTVAATTTVPLLPTVPAATAPAPAPVAAPVAAPSSVAVTTASAMPTEFHEQTPLDVAMDNSSNNNNNNNTITGNGIAPAATVATVGTTATGVPSLFPKTENNKGDISSTLAGIDAATAAAPAPGAIGNSRGHHQPTAQVQQHHSSSSSSSSKDGQKDQAATKFGTNSVTPLSTFA
ncbi:hypothetical protein BGX26_005637 [Mortierella sp. AD094]|nr:hypothetical protein BGX26_005637 [Mortierella sp. AD094]